MDRCADPDPGRGSTRGSSGVKRRRFAWVINTLFNFFSQLFSFFFFVLLLERSALSRSLKNDRRWGSSATVAAAVTVSGDLLAERMAPNRGSGPSGFRSVVIFA